MGTLRRGVWVVLLVSLGPACLGGGGGNNKPAATLPSAPTTLVVPPGGATTARIDLTWIDTADNEFEFRIERSDDGGLNYVQVGTAPKNSLGFTDLGLLPNTTYFYRVAAWNAKGLSAFAGPVSKLTKGMSWAAGSMTGGPGIGKAYHSAIYDSSPAPNGKRMIVFGGLDDGLTVLNEVWSYDLAGDPAGDWTALSTTGTPPLPRWGHSAIYDSVNDRMIVFGGIAEVTPSPQTLIHQNDVHVLNLTTLEWTTPAVTGTPPSPRAFHSAVCVSADQQMIVYGGEDNLGIFDDVLVLNLASFTWSTPSAGARPVKRSQHAGIYDPLREFMVLFAGHDNEIIPDGSDLNNETWTLSVNGTASWDKLFFSGTPGFRMGHTAVYDAANQRMVVFGGDSSAGPTGTDEMWGLRLHVTPSWSILNPTSGSPPSPRFGHSAVYDSGLNRMIIYGGYDDSATAFDEVWVIDL